MHSKKLTVCNRALLMRELNSKFKAKTNREDLILESADEEDSF